MTIVSIDLGIIKTIPAEKFSKQVKDDYFMPFPPFFCVIKNIILVCMSIQKFRFLYQSYMYTFLDAFVCSHSGYSYCVYLMQSYC